MIFAVLLLAMLPSDAELTAQRSWERFRDDQCKLEASASQGGSVHGMVVANCSIALAADRVKQLETQLHCMEGDVSCIAPETK